VIDKSTLQRTKKKLKMHMELKIHKRVKHPNIVRFERFFEDKENVYMMLELCENKSLGELMNQRKQALTEFECRYYFK